MKGLNALRDEVFQINKDNGWHDQRRSFGELIALVHSEVSEALEDYRNGKKVNEVWYEYKQGDKTLVSKQSVIYVPKVNSDEELMRLGKPCGIPSELADIVIRILDICGLYEWDVDKHKGTVFDYEALEIKSFLEFLSETHVHLSQAYLYGLNNLYCLNRLCFVISFIESICQQHSINLESTILEKLEYNKTRGHRHGGKVI